MTTGPGGTNAITGVVGGWLDSIPMLILSGQVRYDTTARWSGVGIRAMGDQEFDIVKAVDCMTKYSEMVIDVAKQKGAALGLSIDARTACIGQDDRFKLPRLDANDYSPKSKRYLEL